MKFTSILALTASAMLVFVDNGIAVPTGNGLGYMEDSGSFKNVALAEHGGKESSSEDHPKKGTADDNSGRGSDKLSGDDPTEKGSQGNGDKDKSGDGHGSKGSGDKTTFDIANDCGEAETVVLGPKGAVIKGDGSEKGPDGDKGSGEDTSDKGSAKGIIKGSGDDHSDKGSGDKSTVVIGTAQDAK
ncbi:hypothetical protein MAM1_0089d04850 [Mucor ambiguus]|uniref:Uncharacterized protein n=1 Tax=Mucor ambiguus TaxID=91626 RepID=A0A0C9LUP4_9FUNG|nr:hypothetical protein MAM1_0089d04850 [Mucor ambiguus]